MRHGLWVWAVLVGACADEATGGGDDDGTEETDVPEDSGADTGTTEPGTDPECFADWSVDISDDGEVDGTGIDVYDAVQTDLLVYSYRFYSVSSYSESYTYDEDGNLVLYEFDDDDDGMIDYVATYTWDELGNIVRYEVDSDGDGDDDYVRTYEWDEDGNIAIYLIDEDGDGDLDHGYSYTYDGDGLRLTSEEDQDGDGLTDIWFTYTYDSVGRRETVTADVGNDGTVDALQTSTYTDPFLHIGTLVLESTIEEYPSETEVFEYDADDRLLFQAEDAGSDLFVDRRYSAVYDPVTGLLTEEDEEYFDPPPYDTNVDWSHNEYQYDHLGRLTEDFEDGHYADQDFEFGRLNREQWAFGGTCP